MVAAAIFMQSLHLSLFISHHALECGCCKCCIGLLVGNFVCFFVYNYIHVYLFLIGFMHDIKRFFLIVLI